MDYKFENRKYIENLKLTAALPPLLKISMPAWLANGCVQATMPLVL